MSTIERWYYQARREKDDPVRVEGQLVVYAFDETDRAPHETQPTRRYIFPKDEFARHESDSKLGASYSVWLPWDEAGGPSKKISLIARFEPEGGPIVLGEQTRHMLPGVEPWLLLPTLADGSAWGLLLLNSNAMDVVPSHDRLRWACAAGRGGSLWLSAVTQTCWAKRAA